MYLKTNVKMIEVLKFALDFVEWLESFINGKFKAIRIFEGLGFISRAQNIDFEDVLEEAMDMSDSKVETLIQIALQYKPNLISEDKLELKKYVFTALFAVLNFYEAIKSIIKLRKK